MEDDDDVDLKEEGEYDGAEQVKYGILIADLKVIENAACVICDPKDEDNDWLDEILHHADSAIDDKLKFYVL